MGGVEDLIKYLNATTNERISIVNGTCDRLILG